MENNRIVYRDSEVNSQISDKGSASNESANNSGSQRLKFEECVKSSPELSINSASNFDDELSLLLNSTMQNDNIFDLLSKKYLSGYAISDAVSGTDVDAHTLFHIWNARKTSQKSLIIYNQNSALEDEHFSVGNNRSLSIKDLFVIFHQQLCYSWQSQLDLIDRNRPMFNIPPQDNLLVHLIDPKTISLVLLVCIFNLGNIKFIGLQNEPKPSCVPGPYLGLMRIESKSDYLKSLSTIYNLAFKENQEETKSEEISTISPECYISTSYFISELDTIYTHILIDEKVCSEYTSPLLLKTFTSWVYGKIALLIFLRRTRARYKDVSSFDILNRFNNILSLICKLLARYKGFRTTQVLTESCTFKNFNFLTLLTVIYSYIYAILSIPVHLLPWERLTFEDIVQSKEKEEPKEDVPIPETPPEQQDQDEPKQMSIPPVYSDFSETAADATCIDNTRRHDILMAHVIGFVNSEGNWIKKKEKFVDAIDTYKLGLSWYLRPTFSNTMYTTSYKAWPTALYYYYLLIEPCGRVWFNWYWRNYEAWNSSNIWAYTQKL
ncbi:hypothetical protein BEWA_004720 [Theileria equi strain WA]|uniref:Uncharacterized protein n=1 Tax=Theileria equi strain WA TaxID=1537102 RepID=L0B1Q8_THEEQ|nr:hypothetical protein BEWA_004720 [Theileria equi strain WA]AFZ81064.1 hypothetical protein BEWA_004720 [Theileria equi strain WA]|eukprot:XP_004830730.1 hypothetical protein BEWA_004720 [Theileria equi strain WA]